jgi:hypothetical protein
MRKLSLSLSLRLEKLLQYLNSNARNAIAHYCIGLSLVRVVIIFGVVLGLRMGVRNLIRMIVRCLFLYFVV